MDILGIKLSRLNKNEVLIKIAEFLKDKKAHYIVTPNPEIILKAQKDEKFFCILNQADLAIADGFGLKIAGWFMGYNLPRITGADLVFDLLKLAQEKKIKVGVLNWEKGLSKKEELFKAFKMKYPALNFEILNLKKEDCESIKILSKINPVDLLIVNLGAPYQEKAIYTLINQVKKPFKIAIGVGGALDFLTDKLKRAPSIVRRFGLEWFWRLIQQPWRLKRIFQAIFVFSAKFLVWRFILPFFYRLNVACLLYKKVKSGYQILIVERAEELGHWQIPQGGTDGESLVVAGSREIREELGTDNFKPIATFANLYSYNFEIKETNKQHNIVFAKRMYGYKGQKQGLLIAEFLGNDSEIKINKYEHHSWRWVDCENFLQVIHPIRQEAGKIYLDKFKNVIGLINN